VREETEMRRTALIVCLVAAGIAIGAVSPVRRRLQPRW